jgi:hypothetical protein
MLSSEAIHDGGNWRRWRCAESALRQKSFDRGRHLILLRALKRLFCFANYHCHALDVDQIQRPDIIRRRIPGHRAAAQCHRRLQARRNASRSLRRRRIDQHASWDAGPYSRIQAGSVAWITLVWPSPPNFRIAWQAAPALPILRRTAAKAHRAQFLHRQRMLFPPPPISATSIDVFCVTPPSADLHRRLAHAIRIDPPARHDQ